jgi:hypothetical protein
MNHRRQASLRRRGAWEVILFTIVAASTVATPVLAYVVGRTRMSLLAWLRHELIARSTVVSAALLLMIGALLPRSGHHRGAPSTGLSSVQRLGAAYLRSSSPFSRDSASSSARMDSKFGDLELAARARRRKDRASTM